ncbi:N-acetylglucosamine-specific PTS transporter subunit IIBC [Oceanisphaera arctica]|uniref:PTS N-acetyl-D-glucosamine transporter n=1 Tax=Oceanisphaera arctica TaxID=641510 RepID=A0A2P5TPU4_9GAMM|nr:N-acetylglucosamine-specific PTS transporter subunit IIBC [Oceanisphaera arctica]PPL17707.1 PTS N-acetyl-D-glucosamine transporter [Oceanisphaera arctica]GHA18540.1 PTS N-acetylmuramic acid transporter subunit IIBC [Oceanisphaera arctica]
MNVPGYLQKLGKALLLPIATLPVAALLLRLGQPDLLDIAFISGAGAAIFNQLPLLFGLAIAVGLTRDDAGAAALAGAVGYFVLTGATNGINSDIDLSFFGGIIAGIIAGHSYNRFHRVRLPAYLAFFGGKRLVPIMTGFFALLVAFIAGVVWPLLQQAVDSVGMAIPTLGAFGQFLYGLLNRGLIPIGLHQVLSSLVWFGWGDCLQLSYEAAGKLQQLCLDPALVQTLTVGGPVPGVDGGVIAGLATEVTRGDLHRFFAGDPTAGVFMAGFYPVMIFGLPAAALAMILTAHRGKRAQVGGLLLSLAVTSLLTGITEPLEFAFLFLAPLLYALHALLTGLALVVANLFGVLHGFGFSAGLFDLVLNWEQATRPWALVVIGVVFAILYFFTFYFAIRIFNLKTPGREEEPRLVDGDKAAIEPGELATEYLAALGGADNLEHIDACITRVRLTIKDPSRVDEVRLTELGVTGMVKLGKQNLQLIVGPQADMLAADIRALTTKP